MQIGQAYKRGGRFSFWAGTEIARTVQRDLAILQHRFCCRLVTAAWLSELGYRRTRCADHLLASTGIWQNQINKRLALAANLVGHLVFSSVDELVFLVRRHTFGLVHHAVHAAFSHFFGLVGH